MPLEAAWQCPAAGLLQGQGSPPAWRDAEGPSQGMSNPWQIAELRPALPEELPRPLAELSCPLSTKPPMHTHGQALLAYLSGSTCLVSASSQLIKGQHLKNTFIISYYCVIILHIIPFQVLSQLSIGKKYVQVETYGSLPRHLGLWLMLEIRRFPRKQAQDTP